MTEIVPKVLKALQKDKKDEQKQEVNSYSTVQPAPPPLGYRCVDSGFTSEHVHMPHTWWPDPARYGQCCVCSCGKRGFMPEVERYNRTFKIKWEE